jgi:hypothetical protein
MDHSETENSKLPAVAEAMAGEVGVARLPPVIWEGGVQTFKAAFAALTCRRVAFPFAQAKRLAH